MRVYFFTTFAINNRKSGFLIILEFDEIINKSAGGEEVKFKSAYCK
jgi:hypothetical protein